jgi:phage tail sheath protein FI
MPVQPTYPGVYVQEIPSGVRTITGVSTSIALFIGQDIWGPVDDPVRCLNYTEFDRNFTSDTSLGDLARSVRLFFLNGGTQCYVKRVAKGATAAKTTLKDGTGVPKDTLIITAKYPGTFGSNIAVVVDNGVAADEFNLEIFTMAKNTAGVFVKTDSQSWLGISMNPLHPRFAIKYVNSKYATLTQPAVANLNRPAVTPAAVAPALRGTQLTPGTNGGVLAKSDYFSTYPSLDKAIDIFNIMVLAKNTTGVALKDLWADASDFCLKRRAILLMDPLESWKSRDDATNLITGVILLRTSLKKDYSALFFPRVTVSEDGTLIQVGPSGAIAGLMARIDSSRGVWKAPAGTEADLRGIAGLEYKFTDEDNGVMNPHAINTLRSFPNGIVNWGARTMDGDDDFGSEYKYIPVRRTALYIEESLYRGLKWVVFEPNDDPLWAQIRLNVGAFMHDLFRQGAFQGKTKQEAYFVKCDSETTTQNDINLGIVNIWVGFAPLKPAEFVILTLQQMTGQIQV